MPRGDNGGKRSGLDRQDADLVEARKAAARIFRQELDRAGRLERRKPQYLEELAARLPETLGRPLPPDPDDDLDDDDYDSR